MPFFSLEPGVYENVEISLSKKSHSLVLENLKNIRS